MLVFLKGFGRRKFIGQGHFFGKKIDQIEKYVTRNRVRGIIRTQWPARISEVRQKRLTAG